MKASKKIPAQNFPKNQHPSPLINVYFKIHGPTTAMVKRKGSILGEFLMSKPAIGQGTPSSPPVFNFCSSPFLIALSYYQSTIQLKLSIRQERLPVLSYRGRGQGQGVETTEAPRDLEQMEDIPEGEIKGAILYADDSNSIHRSPEDIRLFLDI